MNYLVLSQISQQCQKIPWGHPGRWVWGLAKKVNRLLSLCSAAPALQNLSVSLPLWIVQPKYIKYKAGAHWAAKYLSQPSRWWCNTDTAQRMEENYFSKSHPSRDLCRTHSWLTRNDGWAKAAQLRLLERNQSENNTISSQTSKCRPCHRAFLWKPQRFLIDAKGNCESSATHRKRWHVGVWEPYECARREMNPRRTCGVFSKWRLQGERRREMLLEARSFRMDSWS